jgi:hypothetical protein
MTPVTGAEPKRPSELVTATGEDIVDSNDDLASATNPRAKLDVDTIGDSTTSIGVDTTDLDDDTDDGVAPPPAPRPIDAKPLHAPVQHAAPATLERAQTPVPTVGSSMLQAKQGASLPWILVGFLVVAVFALVTYIVLA